MLCQQEEASLGDFLIVQILKKKKKKITEKEKISAGLFICIFSFTFQKKKTSEVAILALIS